jgi:hypothetical protein
MLRGDSIALVISQSIMIQRVFWSFFLVLIGHCAAAQQSNQLWLEYQLDFPFANSYLLEFVPTYQTVLNSEPDGKWWSTGLSSTFEYSITPSIDLTGEIPISYTRQQEDLTSFEVSPIFGARFHITQNRRVSLRFVPRYQLRNFYSSEPDMWEHTNRLRLRGEAWISINKPNLFADNLLYSFVDYEEFIVVDYDVNERYANRRRARIGLGYRLNYRHRIDLAYTFQVSRNSITNDFYSDDGIIQVKYKMYFNPSTTTPK